MALFKYVPAERIDILTNRRIGVPRIWWRRVSIGIAREVKADVHAIPYWASSIDL